jgi:hypothetical protein
MKKRIELHQLNSLLKRIAKLGYDLPSDISENERPDFVVTISGQRIGIETTASVYQEHVRASKLHLELCPNQCIVTTHLQDRDQRRSNDMLLTDMLNLNSEWKDAEQEMRDWHDKIASTLKSKRANLAKPGFQLFDQNWLLIHDEPGLANDTFTYDRACHHTAALFSAPFAGARDFDAVFLLSDRYLFRWHQKNLTLNYDQQSAQQGATARPPQVPIDNDPP